MERAFTLLAVLSLGTRLRLPRLHRWVHVQMHYETGVQPLTSISFTSQWATAVPSPSIGCCSWSRAQTKPDSRSRIKRHDARCFCNDMICAAFVEARLRR
ncbi:hypothetical protein HDV64DRAFT_244473 [Trichoderma sp. TUCIM 5745]